MEFKENDYILGAWHAANPKGIDFMMVVQKKKDTKCFDFEYRFRYDSGTDDPFDGKDRKNFYRGTINGKKTEKDIEDDMHFMMDGLKSKGFTEDIQYIEIKGNMEKFLFKMAQQSYLKLQIYIKNI